MQFTWTLIFVVHSGAVFETGLQTSSAKECLELWNKAFQEIDQAASSRMSTFVLEKAYCVPVQVNDDSVGLLDPDDPLGILD